MLLGLRSRGGREAGRERGRGWRKGGRPASSHPVWPLALAIPDFLSQANSCPKPSSPPRLSPGFAATCSPKQGSDGLRELQQKGCERAAVVSPPLSTGGDPAPEDLRVLDGHGGKSWGRSSGSEPLWLRAVGPAACAAAGLCCCSSVNQHPAEPGPPAAPRTAARHSLSLLLSCHPDPPSSPRAGLCGDLQPHRLTPGPLAAPSSVRWLTAAERHPAAPLPPAPLQGYGCTTRLCLEGSPPCGTQHPHGTGWVRSGAPASAHKLPRSGRFGRLGAKATTPIPRGCGDALPLRAEVIAVCRQN